MKILSLKLRGAIGIRKGLGVDEIEIDFRKLSPGLIALTGRNGSGKTTIMENLHPYRQMVSRDGSLSQHFFLKDSYRFLEFEYEGSTYQSKILIDALTGGSEAYLIKNCKPLNDGKLTTYDTVLEELLGSAELFFNSVFSGQKSKGIAQLKPAERRKLFYELLNLDRYEAYCEYAKKQLNEAQADLSNAQGKLQQITTDIQGGESLNNERLEAEKKLNDLTLEDFGLNDQLQALLPSIKEAERERHTMDASEQNNKRIWKRFQDIDAEVNQLQADRDEHIKEGNQIIQDATGRTERLNKLIANRDKIDESLKQIQILNDDFTALSNLRSELKESLSKLNSEYQSKQLDLAEQSKQITIVNNIRKVTEAKLDGLKSERLRAEKNFEEIEKVPCDTAIGQGCKFLKDAYESRGKIVSLRTEIAKIEHRTKFRLIAHISSL